MGKGSGREHPWTLQCGAARPGRAAWNAPGLWRQPFLNFALKALISPPNVSPDFLTLAVVAFAGPK